MHIEDQDASLNNEIINIETQSVDWEARERMSQEENQIIEDGQDDNADHSDTMNGSLPALSASLTSVRGPVSNETDPETIGFGALKYKDEEQFPSVQNPDKSTEVIDVEGIPEVINSVVLTVEAPVEVETEGVLFGDYHREDISENEEHENPNSDLTNDKEGEKAKDADVVEREMSQADQDELNKRASNFFNRYHKSGGLTGSEPIEVRRLGGVLPFISLLGFDIFDRTEVKVVSESRYLVGKDNDQFIVSLDQAGGMPEDVILTTNGKKFDLRIQGDDNLTTIALLDIDKDANELSSLFTSLSREGFDLGHLRDMAIRGAFEDVLREVILDELRDPSAQFSRAISLRLKSRGYDDSALHSLPMIGKNIADDAIAGENDIEDGEDVRERRVMKPDEAEAFEYVKEILSTYIDPNRLTARTGATYTAVILDDNNRKSVVRLYYNASAVKYVATLIARGSSNQDEKVKVDETKHSLRIPIDVNEYADNIIARLKEIEPSSIS